MRSSLLLCVALPLVACTGGHVAAPGDSVFTADVRKLTLENRGGGFGPLLPPGAACDPQPATYTLTIVGHQLASEYCQVTGSGSTATYTPRSGVRALGDDEWSALVPTLAALIVSDATTCGADKPVLALIVTTGEGDREYGDDFYACRDRSKPYIISHALDSAQQALGELARK
ncbi:MAG TPA: hypothetical protein VF469_28170 [Kofleriaceae bacterium]